MYPADTSLVLQWLGYSPDNDYVFWPQFDRLDWLSTDPQPTTEEIVAQRKPWAASVKREEIYREQEIRSRTLLEFEMPRQGIVLIEEFIAAMPATARPVITQQRPMLWGLKALRDNGNALLNGLQTWIDDIAKTADDIIAFDVAEWSGWAVPRPE